PAPPLEAPTKPGARPEAKRPVAPPRPEPPETRPAAEAPETEPEPQPELELEPEPEALPAPPRFRDRLGRARNLFGGYLTSVRSRERIDDATWEELEEALILADVGAVAAATMLDDLRSRVKAEGITSSEQLVEALKQELITLLDGDPSLDVAGEGTTVWLFVGVNGVGKTTTIGKLGMRQVAAGHKVVMAAGDTFRAAAADQLQMWSERVGATVIRGAEGGDPGAVVFDAVQHAAARGQDIVLADTAGRLHTKTNLMEELKKVKRVAERPPGVVTEVLLVIDATTGQNGLIQARQFADAVGVTGVVLTKLDGTAKGGIVVAIRAELGIPIKLVGLGEGPADLVDFDAKEFVEALFAGADES
ncbi:MAG TPA: signal recognition particle-docking protein FtsY, partial [Acidimicrobiales bacterium]|nr:signal recognition particle-docking protein FtsY [Acidimicrobiales bacterium]